MKHYFHKGRAGMPEHTLYAVIDKKTDDTEFVGTMSEVEAYTGKSRSAILSAISHAKRRGTIRTRYIRIGEEDG